MTNEELFKSDNLIFISKNEQTIGSLYFLGEDEEKNKYRGRIRLCHICGPSIEKDMVKTWKLKEDVEISNRKKDNIKQLISNIKFNYEEYQSDDKSSSHHSRGYFVPNTLNITNEFLKELTKIIEPNLDTVREAERLYKKEVFKDNLVNSLVKINDVVYDLCKDSIETYEISQNDYTNYNRYIDNNNEDNNENNNDSSCSCIIF